MFWRPSDSRHPSDSTSRRRAAKRLQLTFARRARVWFAQSQALIPCLLSCRRGCARAGLTRILSRARCQPALLLEMPPDF
jgi:hypothetical protein